MHKKDKDIESDEGKIFKIFLKIHTDFEYFIYTAIYTYITVKPFPKYVSEPKCKTKNTFCLKIAIFPYIPLCLES